MGYEVKRKPKKSNPDHWRVIHRTWKDGKPEDTCIRADQLLQHGFSPSMTFEEARAHSHHLNAREQVHKRESRAKAAISLRVQLETELEDANVPEGLRLQFEESMRKRFCEDDENQLKQRKLMSHWTYVRRMIKAIGLHPSDWSEAPEHFYNYFAKDAISLEYVSKILLVLNHWGAFYCRRTGKPFLAVPPPRGKKRERIAERYFDAQKPKKKSAPLTPELLASMGG